MLIKNVPVFIAPNFGVHQAICQALHDVVHYPTKITTYEVADKRTACFIAEYETGSQGNKITNRLAGKVYLRNQFGRVSELIETLIDIECQEI